MNTKILAEKIGLGEYDDLLLDIYLDAEKLSYQKERYVAAIQSFEAHYGQGDVKIFSAPGRSEIGGNHTDHQHGEVLAASVNVDTIAVVMGTEDNRVSVISQGYDEIRVSLEELSYIESEKESTKALLKGVLSKMKEKGYCIGGFRAYITSDVLIGAGLSSSAAYETLIGTILSGLYNNGEVSPVEIAIMGQYAENVYFGKPCGLMDQMASSVGGLVHVDFKDPKNPGIEKVSFDMNRFGYSLCITDTKGSHADLTADYAAIPMEMKQVAAHFKQDVLLGITCEDILKEMDALRRSAGDRAVLRALHFVAENERVEAEVKALQKEDMDGFLRLIEASGNSSFKYLQNVYTNQDVSHQNVSLALAISERFLKETGACRVHGGGFAGTMQAFVKNEAVKEYQKLMDGVFGPGSCSILKIRKYGGMQVIS